MKFSMYFSFVLFLVASFEICRAKWTWESMGISASDLNSSSTILDLEFNSTFKIPYSVYNSSSEIPDYKSSPVILNLLSKCLNPTPVVSKCNYEISETMWRYFFGLLEPASNSSIEIPDSVLNSNSRMGESILELFRINSEPYDYSRSIREFHECVSCNDDARTDFVSCIRELSPENQKLMNECCQTVFDDEFCKDVTASYTTYPNSMCENIEKVVEVELCFWDYAEEKGGDLDQYKKCKTQVVNDCCTEDIVI